LYQIFFVVPVRNKENYGAPGGIRRFASLTCRIRVCGDVDGSPWFAKAELIGAPGGIRTPDPQARRRIPTRGRSMTYALVTGIWRRRAAYRGTQDGSQHPKRHPGGTEKAPLANMDVSILKVGGSGSLEVCVSGTVWSQSDRS